MAVTPHIFLRQGKILRIHDKGNLRPLGRAQSLQMRNLRGIEGGELLRAFQGDHILDPIDPGDGVPGSGQQPATLVRGEFLRVGHHIVEDVPGNDEISHDIKWCS
jgi:hypothetical protein